MEEIWKDIPEYEGIYQISNFGRVKSLNYLRTRKEQILKNRKESHGYYFVTLYKNGVGSQKAIHRLVWEAFNGPIPEGMQVNHINEDKTDNRLENLSLVTPKENINWGTRNKRSSKTKSKTVLQYDLNGNFVAQYPSEIKAASVNNFVQSNISACCLGKRKTHRNYIWRFSNI